MVLSWKLQKYARYVGSVQGDENEWKLYESSGESDTPLLLSISETNQLVVTYGSSVQESVSLWNAQHWMKGISKEDSMLIIYRLQNESRRFRVKFSDDKDQSGAGQCSDAVSKLSRHITFRKLPTEDHGLLSQTSSNEDAATQIPRLQGEIPLGTLAKAFSGQLKAQLPEAYKNTNIPSEDISSFVRLCLTDSNFPAFVEQVEKELSKVAQQSDTSS